MILSDMKAVEVALGRLMRPQVKEAYTLETIQKLMEWLGSPQDKVRVVHIAGTSGKTSTSYYTAALLRSAGYTVGLSVSPHIDTVRERTQVNGELIAVDVYCQLMGEFLYLLYKSELQPSYFEAMVAFSYWTFAKMNLDFAVMEVGLGGLLDGTNVVTRADKVCVITDIGYDHQEVLGDTLGEIAAQKAGIILPGNEVFIHEQSDEVMDAVRAIADEKGAKVIVVENATIARSEDLPLFQQRNFGLAYAVVSSIVGRDIDPIAAVNTLVPARMELRKVGTKQVILDGSHNGQKIGALVAAFKEQYPQVKPWLVVSFGHNRQGSMVEGLALLRTISDNLIATSFLAEQDVKRESLPIEVIAAEARKQGFATVREIADIHEALRVALAEANEMVLVTGSFYAMHDVRADLTMKLVS